MSFNETALALIAPAIIMELVGCKEPVGVSDVRAASTTTYLYVAADETYTGHVDLYSGYMNPESAFVRANPLITRGYEEYQGRAYPRMNGFCVFDVPYFEPPGVPACTLYYYQKAHSDYPNLVVKWLYQIESWDPEDDDLFWAAWNSDSIVATDSTHTSNGWYKVPLTPGGCSVIAQIATSSPTGGSFISGWIYTGSQDGWHTEVYGYGDNSPYIKVVYD